MKKRLLSLLLALMMLCTTAGALTLEQARELVEKLYIYDLPEEALNQDTVEDIFAGLDQYSSYFTAEEYQAFLDTMNDVSQTGLGIVSQMADDASSLVIVKVLAGGAAEAAGIEAGDQILAVDGKKISEAANIEETGTWMRGEEGTQVAVTLRRAGGKTETITLTRAAFVIPYTEYELLDGHIGYISCQSFGNETYAHFVEALDEIGGDVSQWMLDLRGNTGGATQAATDVAGIFTGPGVQAVLEQRGPKYFAFVAEEERTTMYPVIVLVDEHSASASELLAAAIRDGRAGLIIGSRTFGKGVAQTLVDQTVEPGYFPDGDAVRITSSRFYSPDGVANDRIGVIPHLLVDDAYAADIAYLLCQDAPGGENGDYLRLHVGSWRWYLSLDQALNAEDGAYRSAFVELLEALWPDADLFMGAGGGQWETVTAAELAQWYHLEEYTPRVFADAGESGFSYELNVLGTYDILRGDENGNVNPREELTRAELCAMLAQALNTNGLVWASRFNDVAGDAWYAPAVNAMAAMGFVTGDGAGNFRPEEVLTGEQMVVIMARLATWMNINFNAQALEGPGEGMLSHTYLIPYSDWAKESAWLMGLARQNIFGNYISYMYADIDDIEPQAPATREQAAATLYRIMELMGNFAP